MEQLPDESMLQKILRLVFLEDRKRTDIAHDDVPPFVTPFGPSIISCGKKLCGMLLCDSNVPHPFIQTSSEHSGPSISTKYSNEVPAP